MTATTPVTDWATDFEVLDPSYVEDPFPIWKDLRATCPIAHTNRRGSNWMPTRYSDITAIAHDIEHFSSLKVAVIPFQGEEPPPDQRILEHGLPPISADPPLHTWTRRLLLPWWTLKWFIQNHVICSCNWFGEYRSRSSERVAASLATRFISCW